MLTLDPHERISVEEALSHKYLEVWHDPRDEPECQVKFDFKSFETVDGLEDMRLLIIDEVKNFREFVRKPIEEQQQIQLQLQIQQREKQQAEEQQQQLQRAQAQEQNDYMDISQTPYTNLETNMVTPQVEEDYPRPQELNDFTFSNLESANASDSMHLYHDLAKPSGSEYIKLEEELGFGLDGAMFNNY